MATYHLSRATEPSNPTDRIRNSLVSTVIWLLCFSTALRLVDGRWSSPVALLVGGVAFFLGSFYFVRRAEMLEVDVDDSGIRSFWNGKPLRAVRRESVRYVRERRGLSGTTLIVSEQRTFFSRFLDRVIVPKRLANHNEYEKIKALALHWLENSEKQPRS